MIEDPEFGALFRDESEEHLQSLESGLLRLETDPTDDATLKQVFRSAHSLKGAARMLGVSTIEAIGHHFETALGEAASGQNRLTSHSVERLYAALDAVRALVEEAITGQPSGVDVAAVLERLSAPESPEIAVAEVAAPRFREEEGAAEFVVEALPKIRAEVSTEVAAEVSTEVAAEVSTEVIVRVEASDADSQAIVAVEAPPPLSTTEAAPVTLPATLSASTSTAAPLAVATWKIETIRVEPAKLDALLSIAGDLVVTATRAHRGLAEIEAATALWEEWSRATIASRRALTEAASRDKASYGGETPSFLVQEMRRSAERESQRLEQVGALLERLRGAFDDVDRLQTIAGEVEESIHNVRLLPLSTVFGLFARPVRDLAKMQEKEVQLLLEGGETAADKRILEEIKDPLMHLIRNAVDHGVETPAEREAQGKPRGATLRLRGYGTATQIVIELRDDGRGLDASAIRGSALRKGLISAEVAAAMTPRELENLIFLPGFSTAAQITDVSGRGVGLDVVRDNVERLRGSVEVESVAGRGCLFRLSMPATLATTRVLLVRCRHHTYALPLAAVHSVQHCTPSDAFLFRGREAIAHENRPVPLTHLAAILGLGPATAADAGFETERAQTERGRPCILLQEGEQRLAILVDSLVDEEEIVLKPLDALLRHSRLVAGTTILDSGEVCLMLNAQNLVQDALSRAVLAAPPVQSAPQAPPRPKLILLAEDSITTRTQEKRILEGAGYQVVTAVDGLDAWHKLAAGKFDAVVTDIEMPNLTGLELCERIREDPKHRELPIVLVTSLSSDADRKRGVEVGANAYISKGQFDQKALLEVLKSLA